MASFNKVILIGNLCADPELKTTPNGVSVTSFSIAVGRRKVKDQEPQTDFINIVAWRSTAEFICKYFQKGKSILVVGSLQSRSWTEPNGQKRYATEVVAEEAQFVEKKNDVAKSHRTPSGDNYPKACQGYSDVLNFPNTPYSDYPTFEEAATDEDLPF